MIEIPVISDRIDQRFDRMEQSINDLQVGVARLEEKTEALDSKIDYQGKAIEAKIDGLGQRIGNQEFINRGVLVALIVAILGGFAKLFGFAGQV
jgi:hypothetical protein